MWLTARSSLASTGYCHYQYWTTCIAKQDGREGTLYCAMVWMVKTGSGAPKQGGCLRVIVLILVQRPRTKRISCKGQGLVRGSEIPYSYCWWPGGRPGAGSDRVVPGRAAARCQPESAALHPEEDSACGGIIIEKAPSKYQRGHSPQTPRGETPQEGNTTEGETANGETHPPTVTNCDLTLLYLKINEILGPGATGDRWLCR